MLYTGPPVIGAVVEGRYKYMHELDLTERCKPISLRRWPAELCEPMAVAAVSPLVAEEWEEALRRHPDREFVEYLVRGIRQGFRIGFNRHLVQLRSAQRSHK